MAVSGKQLKTIAALLSAPTIKQAAIASGIGERTLYRWLAEDEEFKTELRKAELQAVDQATRRLIFSQEPAIDRLLLILNAQTASNTDRLRAARSVLEFSARMIEARDIEERLSKLEEKVNAKQNP